MQLVPCIIITPLPVVPVWAATAPSLASSCDYTQIESDTVKRGDANIQSVPSKQTCTDVLTGSCSVVRCSWGIWCWGGSHSIFTCSILRFHMSEGAREKPRDRLTHFIPKSNW